MRIRESDVITAILATVIGAVGGFSLYFPEIQKNAFPSSESVEWEVAAVDRRVLADTANIRQMLALKPPRPGAAEGEWKRFIAVLDKVKMGKRYSNSGVTTPLLGWYAYIAKHHPASIYELLNNHQSSTSIFNHLIQFGFLKDWPDHLKNKDRVLLNSNEALLSYAISHGETAVQRDVANAFFNSAEDTNNSKQKPLDINLKNILFAMNAMSNNETQRVLPLLKNGIFKFDPRAVKNLVHLKSMTRDDLLALIRMYAYPDKSMSSYMTTGALLGAKDYVKSMVKDVHDNAKQPTNFYCSACGLALATDGLIGEALIRAAAKKQLQVKKSKDGQIILSKKTKDAQVRQSIK